MLGLLLVLIVFTFSPFKLSLFLRLVSVLMRRVCYFLTGRVFVSSALVISFSSGMIILFSYCAIVSNYQTKNKMLGLVLFCLIVGGIFLFLLFRVFSKEGFMLQRVRQGLVSETSVLLFLMIMVFFSIFNINKTYFNPTKKFIQSY